jgi:hypothetical protein
MSLPVLAIAAFRASPRASIGAHLASIRLANMLTQNRSAQAEAQRAVIWRAI